METNISKIEKEEENYVKMAFPIIAEESKANEILNEILKNKLAIIGIDTEAALEMSRFGILCLIQVI
jgi:ribonuclease D